MGHIRVNINPEMLKWARESTGMDLDKAAEFTKVARSKLESYESGTATPTLKQAQNLAKKYNRPFAYFYWDNPPNDPPPPKDFRVGKKKTPLGPAAIFMIRAAQERQEWVKEYVIEEEWGGLSFIGRYSEQGQTRAGGRGHYKRAARESQE